MDFRFSSDVEKNQATMKTDITFDLIIFENNADYLCYVEAVHLLQHEQIKRPCDFIYNKDVLKQGIYEINVDSEKFLRADQRAKEFFFVVDNTDYPEAIFDEGWVPKPIPEDGSEGVFISYQAQLNFTSNTKYFFWTWIFSIVLIGLGSVFVLSLICYWRQTYVYNRYAKERKEYKRQLL